MSSIDAEANNSGTPRRSVSKEERFSPARIGVWVLMIFLVLLSLFPLIIVLKAGLSNPKGFFTQARAILPQDPTWFNFKRVLGMVSREDSIAVGGSGAQFKFFVALKNSLIFTFVALSGQVFFSTLAAYAFARLRFPGKNIIFGILLAGLMIPAAVLFIPNYIFMKDRGWLNTYHGQIAPFFLMTPFAVFFMRQFFLSFPKEMEESARLDGASTFRIFRSIVLPLSKGPIATLSILAMINLWNEFLWPFLIAKNDSKYPLTVALQAFKSQQPQGGIDYPGLMAGTTLAVVPVLVLVVVLGRRVVESLQFSGSK